MHIKGSAIYRRAIHIYGAEHQMNKAKEECAEFIVATLQYEQGRKPVEAVIEELADVMITAQQARLILGAEQVDAVIDRKLARLVETMSAGPMSQVKAKN